jgi:hypothetical protein
VLSAVANPNTGRTYDGLNRPYGFNYTPGSGVATTPAVTYTYDQGFKWALSSVSSSTTYSYT